MPALQKFHYSRRVLRAYLLPGKSQLSFWHDETQLNPRAATASLGEYYMNFAMKAGYNGPHDDCGVPMLNYHGSIGQQYNPIAIAQWGLGNFNLYRQNGGADSRQKFLCASDWLVEKLEPNSHGLT